MTERTGRSVPRWLRRTVTTLVTIVAVVTAVVMGLNFLPYSPPVATSPGALTPEQAESGYAELVAKDRADPTLLPECVSLDVRPTVPQQGVILLFHDYTSCPNQFAALAERLASAGFRVLVPRWPEHGVANATAEPEPVDAQQIADFGMRTTALALGLDKRTVVGGFSGGATLALWAAEHNAGVQRVVALAPFLGPAAVPDLLARATANGMRLLPSVDVWWDLSRKEGSQVPRYNYAKFATRSLSGLMNLGSTLGTTRTSAYVVHVVNPADASADPEAFRALVGRQRDAGNRVTVYELPASLQAPHEYLDPEDPHNKADETFPALVEILTAGTTSRFTAS
ncbi:MAG TPA: alpha/beta fold hydrolase [Lapillicoccus sp.]|nr:alpha/beta fold hydrolase [Lapillicoccus sp.]